jgi:hypothetical protein
MIVIFDTRMQRTVLRTPTLVIRQLVER